MLKSLTILAAALTAIGCMVPDVRNPVRADADENEARQALERGEIRPLDEVLKIAQKRLPGDVVKVKLDRDDGRWKYEIKILTGTGERREVEIDASSLRVLEVE